MTTWNQESFPTAFLNHIKATASVIFVIESLAPIRSTYFDSVLSSTLITVLKGILYTPIRSFPPNKHL